MPCVYHTALLWEIVHLKNGRKRTNTRKQNIVEKGASSFTPNKLNLLDTTKFPSAKHGSNSVITAFPPESSFAAASTQHASPSSLSHFKKDGVDDNDNDDKHGDRTTDAESSIIFLPTPPEPRVLVTTPKSPNGLRPRSFIPPTRPPAAKPPEPSHRPLFRIVENKKSQSPTSLPPRSSLVNPQNSTPRFPRPERRSHERGENHRKQPTRPASPPSASAKANSLEKLAPEALSKAIEAHSARGATQLRRSSIPSVALPPHIFQPLFASLDGVLRYDPPNTDKTLPPTPMASSRASLSPTPSGVPLPHSPASDPSPTPPDKDAPPRTFPTTPTPSLSRTSSRNLPQEPQPIPQIPQSASPPKPLSPAYEPPIPSVPHTPHDPELASPSINTSKNALSAATVHQQSQQQQQQQPSNNPRPASNNSLPWNATHPCYPHINSHVPLSSPLFSSTRIIRIPRDWMVAGDLYPVLSNVYPEILSPWIREVDFRRLIEHLNRVLCQTFDPSGPRAWADAVMGLLTGWLWEDFGLSKSKSGVKEMERIIDSWNEERQRERAGEEGELVEAVHLRRTGFLCLDLVIPDPRVMVVGEAKPGQAQGHETPVLGPARSRANTGPAGRGGGGGGGATATATVDGAPHDDGEHGSEAQTPPLALATKLFEGGDNKSPTGPGLGGAAARANSDAEGREEAPSLEHKPPEPETVTAATGAAVSATPAESTADGAAMGRSEVA